MNKAWPWIFGIVLGLIIVALLLFASSNRDDYWVARGAVPRAIQVTHTEDLTLVRFPCRVHAGSLETANECGFYVWKK